MLPTFLGIGVPRGGTTWLHQMLSTHPDITMPTRRKEVHYFDAMYERGHAWYESFFPPDCDREKYQAVGEITPHYLFFPEATERINMAASPRFPKAYSIITRTSVLLRRHDLDWLPNTLGRKLGLKHIFKRQSGERLRLSDEMREQSIHHFLDDIERVEQILGRGLESWKTTGHRTCPPIDGTATAG